MLAVDRNVTKTTPLRIALLRMQHRFTGIDEIFTALADSLERAGATVQFINTVAEAPCVQSDVLLIIGSPVSYPNLFSDLKALRVDCPQSIPVLFWHFEPLPDPETPLPILAMQVLRAWFHAKRNGRYGMSRGGNFITLYQAMHAGLFDKLFVYTQRKEKFLRRWGIAAEYLPMGYHPLWGHYRNRQRDRDIDVLFLGNMYDNRRGRVVRQVRDALARHDVNVTLSEDIAPAHGLWGEERTAVLNRTRIFLSIYQHPGDGSGMRFSLGMGNGAMIVSEPVTDTGPFVNGEHFVAAPIDRLPDIILRYLADDSARQRICDVAYQMLVEQYHMDATASRIFASGRELIAAQLR